MIIIHQCVMTSLKNVLRLPPTRSIVKMLPRRVRYLFDFDYFAISNSIIADIEFLDRVKDNTLAIPVGLLRSLFKRNIITELPQYLSDMTNYRIYRDRLKETWDIIRFQVGCISAQLVMSLIYGIVFGGIISIILQMIVVYLVVITLPIAYPALREYRKYKLEYKQRRYKYREHRVW